MKRSEKKTAQKTVDGSTPADGADGRTSRKPPPDLRFQETPADGRTTGKSATADFADTVDGGRAGGRTGGKSTVLRNSATVRAVGWGDAAMPLFSLFTSAGTLVCCALPALLVSLGMGAVTVGLVSAFPQLVWLSEHKAWVFAVSGAMLTVAAAARYGQRNAPCPADPEAAKMCMRLRRLSLALVVFSTVIYAAGFFFAFVAARVFE